jgi:hypothetical protein
MLKHCLKGKKIMTRSEQLRMFIINNLELLESKSLTHDERLFYTQFIEKCEEELEEIEFLDDKEKDA